MISAETSLEGGGGSIQVSLIWTYAVDLDLHVIDPNSEEIYYAHTTSVSGGEIDRDNTSGGDITTPAIENVHWESDPTEGSYIVKVNYYSARSYSGSSVDYFVMVCTDGECVAYNDGSVTSVGETDTIVTFTYP